VVEAPASTLPNADTPNGPPSSTAGCWHTPAAPASHDPRDLIIASQAAETGRTICSLDAHAKFSDLPGVDALTPTALG